MSRRTDNLDLATIMIFDEELASKPVKEGNIIIHD